MLYTKENYLTLIDDWKDPFPKPIIINHDGYHVVRDDLIGVGSKARFADYLIKTLPHKEIVYGSSPAHGYAIISISYLCQKYGKNAIFYMAERKLENLHPNQKRAIELGCEMRWVPDGMMVVCEKRAKDYVMEDPKSRILIPMGVDHPIVIASAIKTCESLNVKPDHIWSVGSSGTLTRALQLSFPESEVHVVQVGHTMKPHEYGRAKVHISKYPFSKCVKPEEMPPYPSVPNYDAKLWAIMTEYYKVNKKPEYVLVWNVGA